MTDIFALQDEIASDVARQFHVGPGASRRFTYNAAACEAYLEGRFHWNKYAPGAFMKALTCFERAIAIDAACAPAWAGIAQCTLGLVTEAGFSALEYLPKTAEAARRALELDDTNASAHVNLGHILIQMGGHGDEAVAEVRKGIELAPRSPDGYNVYGVYLAHQGRLEDAIAQMQKAVELSPRSAEFRYNLGRALAAAGRYPEALTHFQAAAELTDRKEPGTLQMLAAMLFETGDPQRATATAQEALRLATDQNDSQMAEKLRKDLDRYLAPGGVSR